jgi:hypothetical protein
MLSHVGAFESKEMISNRRYLFPTSLLTFKVGHVSPDIRVQRIDDHLPVCGASDLNPTVNETRCRWCTLPCIVLADVLGLWQEVEELALVELGLPDLATLEKLLAPCVESTVQDSEEDGDFF